MAPIPPILFDAFFDALPGNSILLGNDAPRFTIRAATPKYLEETGKRKEEILGKGLFEAFPFNASDPGQKGAFYLQDSFAYVMAQKKPHYLPVQRYDLQKKDGSFTERYWKVSNKPVLDADGALVYIIHTAEDITAQVKAEQKSESLKSIEKAYNFFMNAPVIIGLLLGDDYVIEMANEGLLEVWGRTNEVIGKPLLQAIPELSPQGFIELLDNVRKTGESFYAYEFPITLERNGKPEELYFDFVYKPFYVNEGDDTAAGVFSVGHDVTQQVLAKKTVEASEAKYRNLFEAMDQGFCVLQMIMDENNKPVDYRFLETNRMFQEQTGLVNAVGKTARELIPDLEDHWFERYARVALSGESIRFSEGSGALGRWFEVYAFKINEPGALKVALLFTDISERKKAEEAVRESENNLRNLIMQSPVAMCILRGPDFVVEVANERVLEIWGKPAGVMMNRPVFEGLPESKDQGLETLLHQVYHKGERVLANEQPVMLPRKGGLETAYLNFVYEAFKGLDGKTEGVMAVAIDVTDQVKARLMVEEANKELQFALDAMPQMVWVTLPDGYHDFYNKQWYDYTGLSPEASRGNGWNGVFHPDDQERAWEVWKQSLQTGMPYEIEYRLRRHDGIYRWVLGRALPLRDEAGNILKWYGTCTDIDDQRKASEEMDRKIVERTQDLLEANASLKLLNTELEQFTYVSHHDLQEPLRKIIMFTEMVQSESGDRLLGSSRLRLNKVMDAAARMNAALRDVLNYASLNKEEQFVPTDLNEILKVVETDLELVIQEKDARIHSDVLPRIRAVPQQMHQLFYNLLNNAMKFSRPGLPPEVRIISRKLDPMELQQHTELEDGRVYYAFEFRDNGIGFSQAAAEKIFGMFQRLHNRQAYAGTGIGLALCKKVVTNHQGKIWAEGIEGGGATFRVILPED